jgi:fumarate reductase flavoprotein subunit
MSEVRSAAGLVFPTTVQVLVIGAGAAGCCAALAAAEQGAEVLVVERDPLPAGSTALSAGLVPAAGTRFQRAGGIDDSAKLFAADIRGKSNGEADDAVVDAVATGAGPLIEWLADRHGLPFGLVTDFNYSGHSALRMHGLPTRSGRELIDRLRQAVESQDIPIICNAAATALFADADGTIRGVAVSRGGAEERIGCDALVLACNGYGGNPDLVRRFIPEMANALYFGHAGNRGDAVLWGEALGAGLACLSAYQGHGSVASPHNILISWAAIMEGGIQVNREGHRFSDETAGYSEQAAVVLRQPDGIAFVIFDERIAAIARQFRDFQDAERMSAVIAAGTVEELAAALKIPLEAVHAELAAVDTLARTGAPDRFGRRFAADKLLVPPYRAARVTGALFHSQGGLAIDPDARVRRRDGEKFPNLFAAGGAAAGVSGTSAAGYLSGNGLLSATVLGRKAGVSAARLDPPAGRGAN